MFPKGVWNLLLSSLQNPSFAPDQFVETLQIFISFFPEFPEVTSENLFKLYWNITTERNRPESHSGVIIQKIFLKGPIFNPFSDL